MKITQITLYKLEIPMVEPFTTSFGTIYKNPKLIVKATADDGTEGYGEGAAFFFPFYNPETTDTEVLILHDYLAPCVLNKEFSTMEEFVQLYKSVKGNNFAKAALENAVWMIMSLRQNKPLAELLGGTKDKIPVGESLGIKTTVEATLEEVGLRLQQGFQRIKVKIQPGWDIRLVEAIRDKFGDIDLMVDGNSAYTLADVELFKKLDDYNLTMIEQPLADDDIIDHATLQKQIKTPICLDESIQSAEDARKAIEIGACKVINIKPGRVGGLLESKKIHDLCRERGVGVWCGGMLENGIGRAYNLAIASLSGYAYPADMSPVNFFYADDLVKNSFIVDKQGFVAVPKTPGLGFEIDQQKLKHYTTETIVMGRPAQTAVRTRRQPTPVAHR